MACPGCCSEVSIYVSLQTFRGNYDRNGIQTHSFDPPIYGRFVRLNPRGWKSHISMRLELYGCPWSKQFVCSVYYYLSVIFVCFYSYFKFCQELLLTITVYVIVTLLEESRSRPRVWSALEPLKLTHLIGLYNFLKFKCYVRV